MNYFDKKVIWITGASSGIGKELAIQLSKLGAILVLTARRENELEKVKQLCGNVEVHLFPYDLENLENIDELYNTALEIVKSERKASTSFLQRKLQIGYNRAARIVDQMEANGEVSQANHVGKREVLK